MLRAELRERLLALDEFDDEAEPPEALAAYGWSPGILLRHHESGYVVGFHVMQSTILPMALLAEAKGAQDEVPKFAVVVIASLTNANEDVSSYCRDQGFGLLVFTADVIQPVLAPKYAAREPERRRRRAKEGWIPEAVCKRAAALGNIRVASAIRRSLDVLSHPDAELGEAAACVERALKDIIKDQREHLAVPVPFFKLETLEKLLDLQGILRSDHVVHSFRVYVTGCVILDHFWDFLQDAWQTYVGLGEAALDDVWFLASVFHDCGYARSPELRTAAIRVLGFGERDGSELDWPPSEFAERHYQHAAKLLGSLLAHVRRGNGGSWDLGALDGRTEEEMRLRLVQWYSRDPSDHATHGVIGALDLAADMLRRVWALTEGPKEAARVEKAFLASHVFPASAAIAMHHWKLWPEFEESELLPLQARTHPLAGLLLYLDTWDDYRRSEPSDMQVTALDLGANTATVSVRWSTAELGREHAAAYKNYHRNVVWPDEMQLRIELVE